MAFNWMEGFFGSEGLDDLVEEERYAVVQLGGGRFGRGSLRHFHSTSLDQFAAIFRQEFMHHNDWCDWDRVLGQWEGAAPAVD